MIFLAVISCSNYQEKPLSPIGENEHPPNSKNGVLLLAHGVKIKQGNRTINIWNKNVESLGKELNKVFPTEVAFGMADPETIQVAVVKLEQRGIKNIFTIPVFVSSYSPIIGNSRYILGLQNHLAKTTSLKHLERIKSDSKFFFSSAMDSHPIISQTLLERAQDVNVDPTTANVILVAHGPNTQKENDLWLQDMAVHAKYIKEKGNFKSVTFSTLKHDSRIEVKRKIKQQLRQQVKLASKNGEAIIVPLLISAGGIERSIREDLDGLSYKFGEPLMPHPNIRTWIESMFSELGGNSIPHPLK